MNRTSLWLAGLTLFVGSTGCSGTTTPRDDPPEPIDRSAASTPTGATTSAEPNQPVGHPLVAQEATTDPHGGIGFNGILRARDGSTMVVHGPTWPKERTWFRIYGPDWRPRTPLLETRFSLEMGRGLERGFVGRASLCKRDCSRTVFSQWVTVEPDGTLRPVRQDGTSRPVPIRPGDVRFLSPIFNRTLVYRPSERAVLSVPFPRWYHPRQSNWYASDAGAICAHRFAALYVGIGGPEARIGGSVYSSVDEGRSWRELDTGGVLPAGTGPILQACEARGDRVLVMTGGEFPRWLHTLDRSSGMLLASLRLSHAFDVSSWHVFPDGALVLGACQHCPGVSAESRRVIKVATDSTNRAFDSRTAPAPGDLHVVGGDLIIVARGRAHVSDDRGRTWTTVDLRPPSS
jgi:hypothetical protein